MAPSNELRFDGRVAIVTGAGNGLGRSYALEFAKRGASVVVNDLGGSTDGGGKSSAAADKVVSEIKAAGGKAVANYDSVEDGAKIVETALNVFGKIDIVVNNAGILRDRSFARTSDLDWDLIQKVHLKGSFMVTRAAWPHMKKQKYGRIIMTSSAAGIYGNFGQANYSAAKLGLFGLSNTLSIEGAKYNITCNTIAPTAGSRMTKSVMPPDLVEALRPEYIAPLVVYLCHESCEETKGLFEVGAGWAGKLRWQRSPGAMMRSPDSDITAEAVRDNWGDICDFTQATASSDIQGSVMLLAEKLEAAKGPSRQPARAQGSSENVDVAKAMAFKFDKEQFSINPNVLSLYALGVGADPAKDSDDLRFVYERSEHFAGLPTFGVIPAQGALGQLMNVDGLTFNPMMLLHGEQYLEIFNPLPIEGDVISQPRISAILDKGKGAVVVIDVDTTTPSGTPICFNQFTIFLRGIGGFGGNKSSPVTKSLVDIPAGPPTAVVKERTTESQAVLYRLSGDLNPLHIDPEMAAIGGFKKPILHGLCSFGISAHHVLKTYGNNDPASFKAVKVRFAAPVMPGEELETKMWKRGTRIHFETRVTDRDVKVISSAYIDLHTVTTAVSPSQGQAPVAPKQQSLKAEALFAEMKANVTPELVKNVKAIYQWNVLKNGVTEAQWTVDLKNNPGDVYAGTAKQKPGCTITVDDNDLVLLSQGKLNPMKAFMSGKLKVSGNIMLAQKLQSLFDAQKKKPGVSARKAAASQPKSAKLFDLMAAEIGSHPEVAKKVKSIFQWKIKHGGQVSTWTLDLKNAPGAVYAGDAKQKAGCTLTLADDDFIAIAGGKLDSMKAFMSGKLKISGNMMLAQKLKPVFEMLGKDKAAAAVAAPSSTSSLPSTGLQADAVFGEVGSRLNADIVKKTKAVFQWHILKDKKEAAVFTVDLKSGDGSVYSGVAKTKADCSITVADEDLVLLASGKLNPMKAFMSGKLKVKGNIMLAQKLQGIFQAQAKL